jgi:hypothetical protein
MDERMKAVGQALWDEDRAGLEAVLRRHGLWPETERGWEFVGNLEGERLLAVVARFVRWGREKGGRWPDDPWAAFVAAANSEPSKALENLQDERKRRDAKVHAAVVPELEAAVEKMRFRPERERAVSEDPAWQNQLDRLVRDQRLREGK